MQEVQETFPDNICEVLLTAFDFDLELVECLALADAQKVDAFFDERFKEHKMTPEQREASVVWNQFVERNMLFVPINKASCR